jgi:RNA polymerase sigma factor (sigma-70 family)
MVDIETESFISRLRSGEPQAFSDLFQFITPKLRDFLVSKFGLSEVDAEELTADAMVKVHSSISNFRTGEAKLKTWIFKIGKNTAIDYIRKRENLLEKMPMIKIDESVVIKANQEISRKWFRELSNGKETLNDEKRAVFAAFQKLSEQDQDILRLRCCLEYEDICEIEKTDINTLRTRHSRAMQRLRKEIEKCYER